MARRQEAESPEVPLRLYGLRRGTVGICTALCVLFAIFTLIPIAWILINATKNQANIFQSFGFWFAAPFRLFHNLNLLGQDYGGEGVYTHWFANTAIYASLGGVGATALSAFGGYGFAHYDFRGSRALFLMVLSTLFVPIATLTLPLYLMYAKAHLINNIWGFILPSMVAPIGIYLMRVYIRGSVPRELIDAARVDGAGELRIFFRLALPLMVPGLMTVLLLSVVGIWNNYFLPLLIFSNANLYPLTVGLGNWATRAQQAGSAELFPEVVVGGAVTIVPTILLFLVLQRYWRGGILLGSIAGS
jgi:multiple sugar transport system permease protein